MHQVPIRELNQHTADVLARVERGEAVEITRNGRPVAVLEPVTTSPLRRLLESGELRPAEGSTLALPPPSEVPADDETGLAAVLADRDGSTRW